MAHPHTNPHAHARAFAAGGCALALLGFTPLAAASPAFPSTLRAELEMECTPTCSGTCHTTEQGQSGTASRAFAQTLTELGLVSGDEQSLADAVAELGETDTDGDGATDVAELTASPPSDPNDANLIPESPGGGICAAELRYGCGAHYGSTSPGPWGWVLTVLVTMGWRLRVRRPPTHQR